MFFVIVYVARVELHDASGYIMTDPGTQVHDAAIYVVCLYEFFNMVHELLRIIIFERFVLQKQIIRALGSVQHFVIIGVQFFKRGGYALVLQLINDVEIPHNAQQVGD
jgi:hypothetical protein